MSRSRFNPARRWTLSAFRLTWALKNLVVRRFTPAGRLVLVCLVFFALFGLDTGLSMAYQGFTLLAAVLAVEIIFSFFFRAKIDFNRRLPRFGTVGLPLTYRLTAANRSGRPQPGLFLRDDLTDPRPSPEEFAALREPAEKTRNRFDRRVGYMRWLYLVRRSEAQQPGEALLPAIPPGGTAELPLTLTPSRRGRLEFIGPTLARPGPLGLCRALKPVSVPGSLLVLPRRYPTPPLALPGLRRHQPGGVALAGSVGDSEEFTSMRDYRPGDPIRKIHWRSWAKTGRPIVKEYQEEFFVRHALILDTFETEASAEVFEEAVSVAASFASTVRTQESLLDLMFVGPEAYCFTAGRGLAHTDQMLEILASVRVCRNKPFESLSPLVLGRASLLSAGLVVLLGWDEPRRELVRRLVSLGLPLRVMVVTEPDADSLDPGPLTGRPTDFHQLRVGRIEEGLAGL